MSNYFAQSSFETPGLSVVAAIAGREHSFTHKEAMVRVLLPHKGEARPVHDQHARLAPIGLNATGHVSEYDVRRMRVFVDASENEQLAILISNAPRDANQPIAAGMAGSNKLDAEIHSLGEVAQHAAQYWISVLQWRTKRWYLGRRFKGPQSISRTLLVRSDDKTLIATSSLRGMGSVSDPITETEWIDVQSALTQAKMPPLFYQLYFDGQEQWAQGDNRRAVIDFAIACEIFLKTRVETLTPKELFDAGKAHLLRASASVLLNRFLSSLLSRDWVAEHPVTITALRRLIECRNHVVHSHQPRPIDEGECQEFMNATGELLEALGGQSA